MFAELLEANRDQLVRSAEPDAAAEEPLGLAAERHARLAALLEEPPSAIITRCTPITYFTTKDASVNYVATFTGL